MRRAPLIRRTAYRIAASALRRTPIERCPAFWARLLDVKVPRAVRPNAIMSPLGESNINIILDLLHRALAVPGEVAECGVFRGSSLLAIGLALKQRRVDRLVHGFDSFEGFDESVQFDVQLGGQESADKRVGGFNETSYDMVRQKVTLLGLHDIICLHQGYFTQTLPQCASATFSFVHLDCDIYESYRDCLNFFYRRLSPGGIILFDEYNDPPWPGCNLAIDEFLADKPEKPIEASSDHYQKWYIQKR